MSDTLVIAFLTMGASIIATAAGMGWWLAGMFFKMKDDFKTELAQRDLINSERDGRLRQEMQVTMSETRHGLQGRFDQQAAIQKDKDEDQDRAIHALEIRLARAGINGILPPPTPKRTIRDD